MKGFLRLIILSIFGGVLLTSCHFSFSNRNGDKVVKSSGISEKRTIEVTDFTGIDVSGGINVILTDGTKNTIIVETDGNYYPYIDIRVSGKVLKIGVKSGQFNFDRSAIDVYIPGENISYINLSSATHVTSEIKLTANELALDLSSASRFEGETACRNIVAEVSSAAHMEIYGTADVFTLDISSAASVNAENLIARKTVCDASSASSAVLYASEELNIDASSASKVRYAGTPVQIRIETSSGASVSANNN